MAYKPEYGVDDGDIPMEMREKSETGWGVITLGEALLDALVGLALLAVLAAVAACAWFFISPLLEVGRWTAR